MPGISVISGGGSGIGRALAKRLSSRSKPVLIIGRRLDALLETKEQCANPHIVETVSADVSTEEGREKILATLESKYEPNYRSNVENNTSRNDENNIWVKALIHNAASIQPISKLMDVSLHQWREHMAVNVEGPLFLTRKLLPKLTPPASDSRTSRILHVSSGAAHHPYTGWGAYCTSKSALHMIYKVLAQELEVDSRQTITVGSVRPGVVDTPMQELLRLQDEGDMPSVGRLKLMKERGALEDPDVVARFLDWLLDETDDVEFSEREWDVRDEESRHRWEHFE